jgi:sugar/nucleoside kinase (ribokinase family)
MVDVDARVPGVDVLLAAIDVIVVPETFSCAYTGEASPGRAIARLGAAFPDALIIATLGERGSLALAQGREIRTPAFPVSVVDTTGAGDAFRAGLAAAWLRGGEAANLERALAVANATAALNCRAEGAQQGLPSWEEVQTLVSAQS